MDIENTIGARSYEVRNFFLKVLRLAEFLIVRSSLLHSVIAEGEKEFLKYSCLTFIGRMF